MRWCLLANRLLVLLTSLLTYLWEKTSSQQTSSDIADSVNPDAIHSEHATVLFCVLLHCCGADTRPAMKRATVSDVIRTIVFFV